MPLFIDDRAIAFEGAASGPVLDDLHQPKAARDDLVRHASDVHAVIHWPPPRHQRWKVDHRKHTTGAEGAYVNGDDLTVVRSRQRYERKGPRLFRYVDLDAAAGFEADLRVDEEMLVVDYERLFTRVDVSD